MTAPRTPCRLLVGLLAALACTCSLLIRSTAHAETHIMLIAPVPGSVVIDRAPTIVFRSSSPLRADGRLILLDGNDVTALLTEDEAGYRLTIPGSWPAGHHVLGIYAHDLDGVPIAREFQFTSRHSEAFAEITSDHRLSATLKTTLERTVSSDPEETTATDTGEFPYTTLDSYLSSSSSVREGGWTSSARANLRYYDRNAPAIAPEKKGLGLLDFLISADYTATNFGAQVELGDTTIESSKNTIDQLTRRGGQAHLAVGNVTLGGFGVLGRENAYDIDGLGLAFNSNDHIMGTSAAVDLFDRRMQFKAIHVRGGEDNQYLGSWQPTQQRKGDVTGLVVTTDFFEQALMTEFEFDASNFSIDAATEETVADHAYRLLVNGFIDQIDYELGYVYTGPQYEVVGNQSIIRDWAGYHVSGGMTLGNHGLRMLLGYHWDNVEDSDLFARIHSYSGGLEYRYGGWERFPVGLLFEHNQQQSSSEPAGIEPMDLETNTVTGSLGFQSGPWALDIRPSWSEQNDKTDTDYDTRIASLSIAPTYASQWLTVIPSWAMHSSWNLADDVRTDTHTLTLDAAANLFRDFITGECGGTYDWSKADDDSLDMNNTSLYGRLNYRLDSWLYLEDTVIAIEYLYRRQQDNIYDTTFSEGILSLVLSSAIPYSW